MVKEEFNLSKKIWSNPNFGYNVHVKDIKEFIKRDTKLIKMFFDGKMGFRTLCLKRNKLAGNKFSK